MDQAAVKYLYLLNLLPLETTNVYRYLCGITGPQL